MWKGEENDLMCVWLQRRVRRTNAKNQGSKYVGGKTPHAIWLLYSHLITLFWHCTSRVIRIHYPFMSALIQHSDAWHCQRNFLFISVQENVCVRDAECLPGERIQGHYHEKEVGLVARGLRSTSHGRPKEEQNNHPCRLSQHTIRKANRPRKEG